MNYRVIIYGNILIVCVLLFSCKKVKTFQKAEIVHIDSVIKNKYEIVPYSYEIESDTAPSFSVIALNSSSDYMVKTRMAFLEDRFKWNFTEQLDSAFVFGVKENIKEKDRYINFEIWYKVDKNNALKVIDSLNILFDKAVYYKPPTEWHWFLYKDKVFFMDCYKTGINRNLLYETKLKYENDTLFLDYVLDKYKLQK